MVAQKKAHSLSDFSDAIYFGRYGYCLKNKKVGINLEMP
jgi:hypothetical protein